MTTKDLNILSYHAVHAAFIDVRSLPGIWFMQRTPLSVTQRSMRCVTGGNVPVSRPGIEFCCFCQPAQRKHELIFLCRYCFQVRLNMYCDLCKTRKLRREFPLETMTEKCDHAPLHCLRVSIKLRKRAKVAGVPSYR